MQLWDYLSRLLIRIGITPLLAGVHIPSSGLRTPTVPEKTPGIFSDLCHTADDAPRKLAHFLLMGGTAWLILDCARPSQRLFHSQLSYISSEGVARLPFTARIERPQFHRGGSASTKGHLAIPSSPLRVLPRIPRRFHLPRIKRTSPPIL